MTMRPALGARLSAGVLLVLIAPAALAAQGNYSSADVALVEEVSRATARGIPREPLLDKVREGALKRAPEARIRVAVSALADRLARAREALGAVTTPELVAGADALAAGVTVESLRQVRAAAGKRPIAVPLGVLAQLVASGVPVPRATERIVALVQRNVAPQQLVALGASVESDLRMGIAATDALDVRLRGLGIPGLSGSPVTAADLAAPGVGTSVTRPQAPPTGRPRP